MLVSFVNKAPGIQMVKSHNIFVADGLITDAHSYNLSPGASELDNSLHKLAHKAKVSSAAHFMR